MMRFFVALFNLVSMLFQLAIIRIFCILPNANLHVREFATLHSTLCIQQNNKSMNSIPKTKKEKLSKFSHYIGNQNETFHIY